MTPKFIRTTIPERETLGEKLSKKRVALGYDLKEAERSTKIRSKYIELLEAGQYEKLPPDVYVRGFLKNYAGFLKLDPKKVIYLYLKERGLKENISKVTPTTSQSKSRPQTKKPPVVLVTPKRIAIGLAVMGFLIVFGYIGWQINLLTAPPKLTINSPAENSKIDGDSLLVEGKTDAGADVFINDIPIGVDTEGNFKEKVNLQEGVNLIKVSAKNKLNKVTEISRTVLADLEALPSSETSQKSLEMKIVIGPGSTAIFIEADGKTISDKNTVMLPGASREIRANEKIIITATDGGNVRVNLNGKDLGLLGKSGENVKNKQFTINSI